MELTPDRLDRLSSGEASPEEEQELLAGLARESPGAHVPTPGTTPPRAWDVDAAWQRVHASIRLNDGSRSPRPRSGLWQPAGILRWGFTAAVLAGLALAWQVTDPLGSRTVSMVTHDGEQKLIELADGSSVHLAPASELRVRRSSLGAHRHVDLVGEAVFQVASHPRREFRVRAGSVVTTVLGTEFGIRAYPGDAVEVTVLEGRVSVTAEGPQTEVPVLGPGEGVRVVPGSPMEMERGRGEERIRGWQQGHLLFEDAELREVLQELGRWHGVEFRMASEDAGRRRVSGVFPIGRPEAAAEALGLALGLEFRIEGRRITFLAPEGAP